MFRSRALLFLIAPPIPLSMLDLNLLRKDLPAVIDALAQRGIDFDAQRFNELEARRKSVQVETETLQARRNALARLIGQRRSKGEDATAEMAESRQIPARLSELESGLSAIQNELRGWLATLPNLPHQSVPAGKDSNDNVEVRRWLPDGAAAVNGDPQPLAFAPRDHVSVGEPLGLDFETARKLSGSRFMMLRGSMARLHRALAQFMLDVQTLEHGYQECYTPYIVNERTLFGTGQLPKFKDDMFWVTKGGTDNDETQDESAQALESSEKDEAGASDELYLISTSEITLTGSVQDAIVPLQDLPLRMTAHTPCFRSEAGSGGRDVRGMIRQHQFDKVELVQIVHPDESYDALEVMVQHAEVILQRLKLPYRVVQLCVGDMGFSAAKTYDIEVWLPAQNTWREISSISNCEAFQARRMHARFRNEQGRPDFVHTLNGSGLAVGRALVAVLENYQQEDGCVVIPEVLRSYMGNQDVLQPDNGPAVAS